MCFLYGHDHTVLLISNYSNEKNSMVILMMVGPSGHGKSTLLSLLKSTKALPQPVTLFDRQMSYETATVQSSRSFCKER